VDGGEAIGIALDGRRHRTTNTIKRFGRLRQSLSHVLNLVSVAGWVLEVIVGHCTYFGLVNRDVLSIFFATYRFIQKHYWEPAPVWREVRNELAAFKGLMILVSAEWDWQWTSHVFSVDASLSGYGVVKALWDIEDVRTVGRVSERSRYKLGGTQARAHAMHSAGFFWMKVASQWLMFLGSHCAMNMRGQPGRLTRSSQKFQAISSIALGGPMCVQMHGSLMMIF
jgi:hypothetical protein